MELEIKTQQHKSCNLRQVIEALQCGRQPLNLREHKVYDLEQEPDFDSQIADEFSDKLEVLECYRQLKEEAEEKISNYHNSKRSNSSDGANSAPSSSDDKPQERADNPNLQSNET